VRIINIHEAKTHLSRLIEKAAEGEPFVIAKAGKPMVKVTALGAAAPKKPRRVGFLAGHLSVPDDFDSMGRDEIEALFGSTTE
jgi:prevent-host-death family protein